VVEGAVVVFALLEVGQVIGSSREDDVVTHHYRALPDCATLLKPEEVLQVEVLHVVDEDQIERPVLLDEILVCLDDSLMDGHSVGQSGMLVDAVGDAGEVLVGLDGVHLSSRNGSKQESGVATVSAELKDSLGLVLGDDIPDDLALVVAEVHHPGLSAEGIDTVEDGLGIFGRGVINHILEQFVFCIGSVSHAGLSIDRPVFLVFVAFLIRHAKYDNSITYLQHSIELISPLGSPTLSDSD
jgi:hypothetical protein